MESIALVVKGRPRPVGRIEVMRVLPDRRCRNVGPFVFLDHMGPLQLPAGEGADVLPHPHIGLSTVTWLYQGSLVHRDSLGSVQLIEPGAVNLMAAGSGIVHSERSTAEEKTRGAALHGLQLWLALPLADEDGPPSFQHHEGDALPSWDEGGARVQLLLGEAFGRRSRAVDPSRPVLIDVVLPAGASFEVPREIAECAVYVVEGTLAAEGARFESRQLLVRAPGAALRIEGPGRAMVLGGPPLDAPRHIDWNFVSSSPARIARAKDDWRAQRFPKIPGDDVEFVPLP